MFIYSSIERGYPNKDVNKIVGRTNVGQQSKDALRIFPPRLRWTVFNQKYSARESQDDGFLMAHSSCSCWRCVIAGSILRFLVHDSRSSPGFFKCVKHKYCSRKRSLQSFVRFAILASSQRPDVQNCTTIVPVVSSVYSRRGCRRSDGEAK
jgi:hypothetical protein